ncbi:hypothetical protein SO802_005711 [Lithocarpus litseifolius]|uniref:Uncharacterized protein n=1 Tax=Lithocarpus litseifolius TaxID=425828 RepID=A0AAW2DLP4_9ROSI
MWHLRAACDVAHVSPRQTRVRCPFCHVRASQSISFQKNPLPIAMSTNSLQRRMKTTESLKKLIVSELSLWSGDVETMVASTNRNFKTLDWLQRDCTKFYDAVRALLSCFAQLSSLETELQTHQNEEEPNASNFQAQSKEALARSEVKYKKAIEWVSGLKSQVSKKAIDWVSGLKSQVSKIREVMQKLWHGSK